MGKAVKPTNVFKKGDRIFAKIKGSPYWPAKIEATPKDLLAKNRYNIKFYGTYDYFVAKVETLVPYNDETRKTHGQPKKLKGFSEGLWEIEHNPHLKKSITEETGKEEANKEEEESDTSSNEDQWNHESKASNSGKSSVNNSDLVDDEESNGPSEEGRKSEEISTDLGSRRRSSRIQVKEDEPMEESKVKTKSKQQITPPKVKSTGEKVKSSQEIDMKDESSNDSVQSKSDSKQRPVRRSIRAASNNQSSNSISSKSVASGSSESKDEGLNDSMDSKTIESLGENSNENSESSSLRRQSSRTKQPNKKYQSTETSPTPNKNVEETKDVRSASRKSLSKKDKDNEDSRTPVDEESSSTSSSDSGPKQDKNTAVENNDESAVKANDTEDLSKIDVDADEQIPIVVKKSMAPAEQIYDNKELDNNKQPTDEKEFKNNNDTVVKASINSTKADTDEVINSDVPSPSPSQVKTSNRSTDENRKDKKSDDLKSPLTPKSLNCNKAKLSIDEEPKITTKDESKLLEEKKLKWKQMTPQERITEKSKLKAKKTLEKKKLYIKSIQIQNALYRMNDEIKKSLSINNTDVEKCCLIMEDMVKLPFTQRHLFNKPEIVETIKKCTKYKDPKVKNIANECFQKIRYMFPVHSGDMFNSIFEKERENFLTENYDELKKERSIATQLADLLENCNKRKASVRSLKDMEPDAKKSKLTRCETIETKVELI